MTKNQAWVSNPRALARRRKRSPLLRGCSALAAAIALAGMWSPAVLAQTAMPAARPAPQPIDSRAILQMRSTPEVRTIASAPYMADMGMRFDAPVLPNTGSPIPIGSAPNPSSPLPAPNTGGSIPNQTIAAIEGSVTSVTGPEPKVAARANGTISGQGTIAVQSGSVVVNRSPTKDQIEVRTPEAVLNWTTLDTATIDSTTDAINFLPAGTELEFVGTGTDYTVLNRIFGTPNASGVYRGIAFEGTVTSRLSDAGPIGGNVWFYSPGGILVSSTAAFNVGGLVLTTSNLAQIDKLGTELTFLGVTEPGSQVMIENGAAVNAGDYVVLWAPRVEQAGNVQALGNVSYVGAEQGQLIVTGGLFDMSVSVGTEDANGLVHTGTTGGATPVDNPTRAISMTSVAKNDFVTMLVGGNIGYANASAASVNNGVVLLTAGEDGKPGSGNIALGAGAFTSSTLMRAFGETTIKLDGQNETLTVGNAANESDFFIISEGELNISATGGSSIFAADNFFALAGDGRTGGTVNITVDDAGRDDDTSFSGLIVGGDLTVGVQAVGTNDIGTGGFGGDATGGQININLSRGGEIIAGGNLSLQAFAQAGFGEARAGTATGGTVNVTITGANSRLLVGGSITADTSGRAAVNPAFGGFDPFVGGNSTGGDIRFSLVDGLLTAGQIQLSSSATATSGIQATADTADALSGSISFANSATINAPIISLTANADGGAGGQSFDTSISGEGGSAIGGNITLSGVADFIGLTTLEINSLANGGAGGTSNNNGIGGTGGNAAGGDVVIDFTSGTFEPTSVTIDVSAVGGQGGTGLTSSRTGDGGNATAGNVSIELQTVSTAASSVSIFTQGVGGTVGATSGEGNFTGGDAGTGLGGQVSLNVSGAGNSFDISDGLTINSSGEGGNGFSTGSAGAIDGNAGDGEGGSITISALDGATITAGPAPTQIFLSATGYSGSVRGRRTTSAAAGSFGFGTGGNISITADGTGSLVEFATGRTAFDVGAFGAGTTGGTILIDASNSGSIVATGRLEAFAQAENFSLFDTSSGVGGTITVNTSAGSSLTANSLLLDASGNDSGAASALTEGLQGGSTTGGTIVLNNSGTLTVASVEMRSTGLGGDGGDGAASGDGGAGGTGTGGAASFNSTGTIVGLTFLEANTDGTGGAGGNGGFGGSGGTGGAGIGGTSEVVGGNDLATLVDLSVRATGLGGAGGNGLTGGAAGTGGSGTGGTAELFVAGTGPLLGDLADASIEAGAQGGTGGFGGSGDSVADGGTGGVGGTATGGIAAFVIGGIGASYDLDSQVIVLDADAMGGTGGTGGVNAFGGTAGDGGTGGDATGGAVSLEVGSGSTLTLLQASSDPFLLSATGTGGLGGTGGGIDLVSGGSAGNGGDGGAGTGGSPRLIAVGGTIDGSAVSLVAEGVGSAGGTGGTSGGDIPTALGAQGNGGTGVGGTPTIETFDGSPGIITLGTVTIDASGLAGGGTVTGSTAGGQITITDGSADPAGLISMTNLTVTAAGTSTTAGTASLTLGSDSGPITVTNNMVADVSGDIVFNFDGNGQLIVGNNAALNAAGDILLTHTNNTADRISLDVAGNILAQAFGGSIDAQPGSIISGNEVFLLASGDIDGDDVRSVPGLIITAGGNVLVNNASATGPQGGSNFSGITIDAGLNPFFSPVYDNAAEARITGTVDSYANITVRSGGNAVFASGSTTVANDRLSVQTGDDIIVETGASLVSGRNPATAPDPSNPFNGVAALELQAGGLGNLLSIPLTTVASLVVGGTLDANNGAIIASAGAIDGLAGDFIASSIALDINGAPMTGMIQSDDAGLLSASCLQGNICVGNIAADNVLAIGQNSDNDVIQAIVEQGTVDANDILITTRNDIVMGTSGIATTLNAANVFSATSISGDVNLLDATISSGNILIEAAGSLLGSASLTSTGDIGITVGQDLNAASIVTGGELTTVADVSDAPEGFFSVPGNINIGTLEVGIGGVNYSANGNIEIGTIIVPGTDINLSAGGLAQLGFTDTANNVSLDGGSVVFGAIDATGDVAADSSSTIDIGTITAGNDIDLLAVGAITGGDLTATGSLSLDGGSIAIGNASANLIGLTSGSDILFDLLQSPNGITLIAANGVVGANSGPGDIESDGNVSLTAQAIALNDITAGGSVDAQATAGNASFGTVETAADITITASGTPTLVNGISGGKTSITGQSVAFDNGTIGGDLALIATAGNVSSNGTVSVGGGIALNASGDIAFGSLEAQGGDFLVDAGGAISFVAATGSALVEMSAGSAFQGDTVDAAGDVSLEGSAVSVTELLSGGSVDVTASAGGISLANTIAFGSITLGATGDILADHAEAGTDFSGTADGNFTTGLNSIITGGDIQIVAGNIVNLGNSTAGGLIDVQGSQINFVTLIAGGSIDLLTAVTPNTSVGNGNIAGTTVTAGPGGSSMDAFGSILIGGTMTIGGGLTLDAANDIVITATDVQGGDFIATAGGSISHGTTDVSDTLDFLAQSGDILGTGTVTTGNGAFLEATLGSIAGTEMFVGDGLDVLAGGTVDLQDVILSAGPAKITAGGNITLQDVIGGDGTDITISSSNGTASFADLQAAGFVSVFAGNGPLVGLSIDAGSNATVEGDTVDVGSIVSGGDLSGIANVGGLLLGNAQASDSIALSAATDVSTGSLDAGAGISVGGESFSGTSLAAGTSIVIATAGDAQFTSASAGSDIDLVTGGDALADSLDAGDAIAVEADGLAQFGSVSTGTASGSTITISGHDGVVLNELTGFDASLISVAGPVSVDTEIDLAGSLAAEGNSVLLRSTKDLVVSSIANDGGIDISTLGNLTAAGAGATADILLSSPGDIVISDNVVAGGNLSVDAGNLVDVQALASGVSIDVFSSDIVIGSDGAFGESDRTQAINFNSRASSATLGGAGGASDYQLDNDEFSRVFSGDRVSLISGDSDSGLLPVTINELSVIAGAASDATDGNIGQGGGLFVIGSSIDVIGEAIVSNAGLEAELGLFASGDVFLDAETGLLEVQAGTGDYTGSILIEAENFYAMTGAALADIQGLSIEDIDARLADSDGLDIPEGVIRAGTLDITTIASDVFIQNTVPGTAFDDRRGFTVDQLLISDPSSSVQPIVINGVISGNTGIDAIPLADISSDFDSGSTLNGCLIADPSSCIVIPIDIGTGDNPLRDLIDEEIEDDPVDTATIDTELVQLREDPLRRDDPLIDEPVTGAGNEDLWDFDSGEDEECESDENGVCLAQAAE